MPTGEGYTRASESDASAGARALHMAEGILMGIRGVSAEDALAELIDAAHSAALSPFALAEALVAAVGRTHAANDARLRSVVMDRWGDELRLKK